MAVQLTIDLNDQQQALIEQVAAVVAPGATPAQIKAWAEGVCKDALRAESRNLMIQNYLKDTWNAAWPE